MVKSEDAEDILINEHHSRNGESTHAERSECPSPKKKRAGPSNPPPVWAETRQELAESLPYYRAYQSGSYTVGPYLKDSDLTHRSRPQPSDGESDFHKDSTPYAYLLGGHGSERDAWAQGGRVIVSHGGGHAAAPSTSKVKKETNTDLSSSPASTHLRLTSSQSRKDPRVAALISSYETGTPCILILGENYPLTDFELNCGFACLGWYAITACWAEQEQDDMVRWKVRFQWLKQQGTPWWLPSDAGDSRLPWNPRLRREVADKPCDDSVEQHRRPTKRTTSEKEPRIRLAERAKRRRIQSVCDQLSGTLDSFHRQEVHTFKVGHWLQHTSAEHKRKCCHCYNTSPQVYSEGWTCLTPECNAGFWQFKRPKLEDSFTFCNHFLEPYPTEAMKGVSVPFPLEPVANGDDRSDNGISGLFCPQCHRLSCREYLAFQQCRHCGWMPSGTDHLHVDRPLAEGKTLNQAALNLLDDVYVNPRFKISVNRRLEGPFEVITLCLPEVFLDSKIHVIQHYTGPKKDGESPSSDTEVDTLLSSLQEEEVNLRRHELTMHRSCSNGSKSRLLTQMFTCNIGAAYKHSTATETIPFEESPASILKAKDILETRGQLVNTHQEFNELYPCAYISGMKMNYHDDGESGLAPVVSSLSLGNVSARMNFRLKKKFVLTDINNDSDTKKEVTPPTILQAYKEKQKAAIQSMLKIPAHDRVAVSLPLRHGTIVIQEGKALQECLEHAVLPNWEKNSSKDSQQSHSRGMRFAITARRID